MSIAPRRSDVLSMRADAEWLAELLIDLEEDEPGELSPQVRRCR